jgi:hypothetical protein
MFWAFARTAHHVFGHRQPAVQLAVEHSELPVTIRKRPESDVNVSTGGGGKDAADYGTKRAKMWRPGCVEQ